MSVSALAAPRLTEAFDGCTVALLGSGLPGSPLTAVVVGDHVPDPDSLQYDWYVDGLLLFTSVVPTLTPWEDWAGKEVSVVGVAWTDGAGAEFSERSVAVRVLAAPQRRASDDGCRS